MRVLVTGGAGYIGSHTCVELLNSGHEVCVIDNLCNGHEAALKRVQNITNCELQFFNADIRDVDALNKIFGTFKPQLIIDQMCEDTWQWQINNPRGYDIRIFKDTEFPVKI